jgi:hypothetical protein
MTGSADDRETGQLTFHRLTKPLLDGRVRILLEVRRDDGQLAGRITRTRGGWEFRPAGGAEGRGAVGRAAGEAGEAGEGKGWRGLVGQVFPTTGECKRALTGEGADNAMGEA